MIDVLTLIATYGRIMEEIGYASCLEETDPIMIKLRKKSKECWHEICKALGEVSK